MVPFYVLIIVFVVFKGLGLIGISYFEGWQTSLQLAAAVMLLVTASAHWGSRRPDLIRMVPSAFPKPDRIVTITGVLEIVGAIGLLLPVTTKAAAICLTTLLIAMFPANVKAAKHRLTIGGRQVPNLFVRTVLQIIFITAVLLAGFLPA